MRQEEKRNRVEQAVRSFYEEKSVAPHLVDSVLYSIQAGGKRLRPLLLLELLEAFGQELTEAHFQVAGALEMIHTGSLIHDDLPAMDNDDYRRGQLTNHKKFGEDLAILAGDALFLDPFGMIAASALPDAVKVSLILELSDASGSRGMVAGQVLDMEGEHKQLTLAELQTIHANKTGRLLAYPFIAAGLILELQADIGQLLEKILVASSKMGTLDRLPVINWRKVGMTSNHHAPYDLGYTRDVAMLVLQLIRSLS